MRRAELCAIGQDYVTHVNRLLMKHASKGAMKEVQRAKQLGENLVRELYNWRGHVHQAVEARQEKAAAQRLIEPFELHWRGSGARQIIHGWIRAADIAGYSVSSLRVRLSQGKGSVTVARVDPITMTEDALTIRRVNYVPGKGRPRNENA